MFCKISAWDVMHEQACCYDEAATLQLSIAEAFWAIWIVSMEECSSLMQNVMQIHFSICSVILNAKAPQYTCSLNDIYRPHWLVQLSCHCSHIYIPVPPSLATRLRQHYTNCSHYINNGWTFSGQTSSYSLYILDISPFSDS